MFKIVILEILIYMALNILCFIIGAVFNIFLTLDQASIIVSILLILNFIWLILRLYKRKTKNRSAYPPIASNKPAPINKEIVIEYNDSKGEVTSRKIRVKEIKYDQKKRKMVPYSLYAYCFLKKAPRTFVLNRIISAYDAETGEIISDIPKYLVK